MSSSFCSALSPAVPLLLYSSAERAELSHCWGPESASPPRHYQGDLRTRAHALHLGPGHPASSAGGWLTKHHTGQKRHAGPADGKHVRACLTKCRQREKRSFSGGAWREAGCLKDGFLLPTIYPDSSLTFLFHGPGGCAVRVRTRFRQLLRISRGLFLQGS